MKGRKPYSTRRCPLLTLAVILLYLLSLPLQSSAQIDSRNQTKPKQEQPKIPVNKKKRKGPKGKRNRVISNKKQVKQSKKSFNKRGERPVTRDIAGRKVKARRTPRQTYVRPAPDPYEKRRIRTEGQRAGPPPPSVRTATRPGERPRLGDISGRKRIRQRSVSSARHITYPQPNPYVGRKIRTEKRRAYSNRKQLRSIRTVSRPSETRKPIRRNRPVSLSGTTRIRSRRNVYRNHERRPGERSTTKDIAGRKLRTRNKRSAPPSDGGKEFAFKDPYITRQHFGEGQRFKGARVGAAIRTTRISGEDIASNRRRRPPRTKNFRSSRPRRIARAKPVRSVSGGGRRGERAIFAKAKAKGVRSVTRRSEAMPYRRPPSPASVSGIRKQYRPKNTYHDKDRHFGENFSLKDIAGKPLRKKNYRSVKPNGATSGFIPYYGRSAPSSRSKSVLRVAPRSISGRNWNNNGERIKGKSLFAGSSEFSGRRKAVRPLKGGGSITTRWNNKGRPIKGKSMFANYTKYRGRLRAVPQEKGGGSITTRWNNKGRPVKGRSLFANYTEYRGRLRTVPQEKGGGSITIRWNNRGRPVKGRSMFANYTEYRGRLRATPPEKGGGSITTRWNNRGRPVKGRSLFANYTEYRGRLRATPPEKGGGSITTRWNNKGRPVKGRSMFANYTEYRGRLRATPPEKGGGSITTRWNNKGRPIKGRSLFANFTEYPGDIKYKRPLKGGGSITTRWNNEGKPIRNQSVQTDVGRFAGNMKVKRPLKGGGSITVHWNNKETPIQSQGRSAAMENASRFKGKMPISSIPGYSREKISTYQGNVKVSTLFKTQYPVGEFRGPVKINPRQGRTQSEGTGRGRTRTFTFLRIGQPNKAGLVSQYPDFQVNNSLNKAVRKTNKARDLPALGTQRGRTRSLSFLALGHPKKAGFKSETKRLEYNKQLPKELSPTQHLRIANSEGTSRGRVRTLSFWTLGNPSHAGFYRNPAQAKGRLHPSSRYTASDKPINGKEEKEKTFRFRIWWAKIFKRNGNQPDNLRHKGKRPRYDKGERDIWETTTREDWYK